MPKVLLQRFRDGQLELVESPIPKAHPNGLLVQTVASVVSPGTERMLLDFGRSSLLEKARKQPGRVAEVLQKASTDGVAATLAAVQSKLDEPTPLGYANAGIVREVGAGAMGFRVGDLVATNGPHAEWVSVPSTLAAPVPLHLEPRYAAFATLGGVALQGVRLAQPDYGETFVVAGLGLIGLLTVQILLSNGCHVIAIDPNAERRALAQAFGAQSTPPGDNAIEMSNGISSGRGVDGVIVCANTASSDPIRQAAQMSRLRGRIVLVGMTGLNIDRSDFYEKELTFQVSASFGPGKYDPAYELRGYDYPYGMVRWTAGRNMVAIVEAIASNRIDVGCLISHEFQFNDVTAAYETILRDNGALGVVLNYGGSPDCDTRSSCIADVSRQAGTDRQAIQRRPTPRRTLPLGRTPSRGQVAVIGAGNYATRTLLPSLVAAGIPIATILSSGGTSAAVAARRFGARSAGTDVDALWDSDEIDTVVIATRHDSHSTLAAQALRSGKNVLVEKPLAATVDQLRLFTTILDSIGEEIMPLLMVGFNRRFAPISVEMRHTLSRTPAPKALSLTMNAGALPSTHWAVDPAVGGGRLVGEACHMIDLARFLVGAPITTVETHRLDGASGDSASVSLEFRDGSIATVNYFSNGSTRYPKERVEAFCGGRTLVNDNFTKLRSYDRHFHVRRRQDKGHVQMLQATFNAIRTGEPSPIAVGELLEISEVALSAQHGA